MLRGECIFRGVSLYQEYGLITGTANDVLLPKLRERKIKIPNRDGAYDYGAENYEERILAVTFAPSRELTRAEVREVSALLSQKGKIIMWDEPDKYYIGRIYDAEPLKRMGVNRPKVEARFTCEPFAYSAVKSDVLRLGTNKNNYKGTAQTPTVIQISNTGTTEIKNITITITQRSE